MRATESALSENARKFSRLFNESAYTYRQYASDCRRIAETMSAKDKTIMLEMAKVWAERAEDAERAEKNKGDRT